MTVLRSGSASDVGRVRTVNQDLPLERPNLYAVADGMGGHVGGEVAARVAVETLDQAFEREPTVEGLREAFSEANAAVWHESQSNSDLRGMGTTLTAVALVGGPEGRDVLALANVGDSRAYVFSGGEMTQVTDDHSLAEERMRHGEMTEEEAAVHPQRHILTRALGVSAQVEADMWELELRTGDRVLLCSDGLTNEVGSDEIADILREVDDPAEAAQQLVDAANGHGGADNITVVVVDVQVGEEGDGAVGEGDAARARRPRGGRHGCRSGGRSRRQRGDRPGQRRPPSLTRTPSRGRPTRRRWCPRSGRTRRWPRGPASSSATSPPRWRRPARAATSSSWAPRPRCRWPARRPVSRPRPPIERRTSRRERKAAAPAGAASGIPRRITPRVIGFVILVAAVPVAAYYVLKWYAYDNWIVTAQGKQIVVQQGQLGGVLWFHPKVVDHTGFTTGQIDPSAVGPVQAGVQRPSLHAAQALCDQHHHHDDHHDHDDPNHDDDVAPIPESSPRPRCRLPDDHDHVPVTTTTVPVTTTTAAP